MGVLGWCYVERWRGISVTVNGQEVSVRVNSTVDELLRGNDYFGVRAGRLLSVGGNVLQEDGGQRCTVSLERDGGSTSIESTAYGSTIVGEGSTLTVSDGADATEPHTEETTAISPGLHMETGGAIQYVKQWGKAGKKAVWTGERSGEVVDKGVVEQAQDLVIGSLNVKPAGKKKCVALTFDDGPGPYTRQILDVLKKKDAKATFFNLGSNAAQDPGQAKAVLDAGCELASHTHSHKNLPTLDAEGLRSEISSAFDALEAATGARPQMIRAPYGAFTAAEWARAGDLIGCNVLWNIDTLDWKRPGSDAITKTVLGQAFNGAIVLMHDGGGEREQTVAALPGIIDGLREAGYELVTVSELMALDERFPEDVVKGTVSVPRDAAMPEMR